MWHIVRVTAMSQGVLDRFLGPHLRMRYYCYLTTSTLSQYRANGCRYTDARFWSSREKGGKEEEKKNGRKRERLLYPSL